MRFAWMVVVATVAHAEIPHLTVEGGLSTGTSSELRPLAFSPTLEVFLVERSDKRPEGPKIEVERSLSFHGRNLDLLGYFTLSTDAGVSTENVQWMGEGTAAQKGALAELATQARQKFIVEPKALDKLWADWQKLKPVTCPMRAVKREGSVDLVIKDLAVATIDTPLAPADAKRNCSAPAPGALRCSSGPDGNLVVVVPFKQDCGVSQQALLLYNPRSIDYLKEAQAAELALKKNDLAGARKHLEESLKLEPKHAPAHFLHACTNARGGMSFKEGRAELEQILGSEQERQTWLPRIKSDPNLANWRLDADFARWLAQFPTRVPIK